MSKLQAGQRVSFVASAEFCVSLHLSKATTMAKVLIGCEYSATVRDAFRKLGHDAWSCDLEDCDGDPKWHRQRDVFDVIDEGGWDLAIFHRTIQTEIVA
jgi:hypothetical protein